MRQQYTPSKLYSLWGNFEPPAELLFQRDILWRRKYIHRGSRCNKITNKAIPSLWSANRLEVKPDRGVDHRVLASLPRSNGHTHFKRRKVGLYNIRSISNKAPLINEFITDHEIDFLCLTETWQQSNDFFHLNQAVPSGFVYICKPRTSGRGGGLALLYRENIKLTPLILPDQSSFVMLAVELQGATPTIITVLYRPPKPSSVFIAELSTVLTELNAMSPNIILVGDFNVHMDKSSKTCTKDLMDMLDCFNITQYVNFPTHNKGHILDLVCCSGITPANFSTAELPISDHKAVLFDTCLSIRKAKVQRAMSYRNIKKVEPEAFTSLVASYPCPSSNASAADLVDHYNNCLSTALDSLAPLKTRTVSFVHSAPWFTPELRQMKSMGRRLERLSKKTGLAVHQGMYSEHILQ